MGDASQHFFKFIEAVYNCPAVWDVSSLAYKDTNKNKQNKTEERADKLGFVQTFLFLHCFLFLLFFSSVSLLYASATTLKNRPCCKLLCLLFDMSLTCEGKSLSTFRSFPTRVCQLKFAVRRPLQSPEIFGLQFQNLRRSRVIFGNRQSTFLLDEQKATKSFVLLLFVAIYQEPLLFSHQIFRSSL